MQPTAAIKARLLTVDVLRGFALFGIMLAHFIFWYTAGPLPGEVYNKFGDAGSSIVVMFNNVFIQGKFFSFFSFLFGLSFYLQLGDGSGKGLSVGRYAWRLVLLMLMGLVHHAFWQGDILSIYAPLGFALLLLRPLHNKWVLALGILLVINLPGRITGLVDLLNSPAANAGEPYFAKMGAAYQSVITGNSWLDLLTYNLRNFSGKMDFQVFSGRLYITLGFFLLGMLAGRKKWFQHYDAAKPVLKKIFKISGFMALATLVMGVGIMLANGILGLGWQQNPLVGFFFSSVYDVFNAALTVFIITGVTLLTYRRKWQQLLYPLAPVGKMALTIYIMQTAFGLLLFYGVGAGLYAKTSPGLNYLMGMAFFALQVVFSKWWLQKFNYGPLEWLWRSATYMQWQSFVKRNNIFIIPDDSLPAVKVHVQPAEEVKEV